MKAGFRPFQPVELGIIEGIPADDPQAFKDAFRARSGIVSRRKPVTVVRVEGTWS
jgi:hypothetical protein